MKKTAYLFFIIILSVMFAPLVSAEDWRSEFVDALKKGKEVRLPAGGEKGQGLAYTPPEDVVLEEAVSRAMENKAPACECMKLAIDFDYNPYLVLKNIYGFGGDLEIDQLCMCATEAGIMKAIIANAAADAVTPMNEPVFDRDEITQSQCLGGEEGLAYTAAAQPLTPVKVNPTTQNNTASNSIP